MSSSSRGSVRILTPAEIRADSTPDEVVKELVWKDTATTLGGLPKRGKTFFAAQMALCIAAGVPFLGLQTLRLNVLYLTWEVSAATLFKRLRDISANVGMPDVESVIDTGSLSFYGHQRNETAPSFDLRSVHSPDWEKVKELKEEAGAHVLILDTVSRVAGLADKDTLGWRGFMSAQTQFARDNECSILSIDHISRMREDGDASVALAGAQSKGSDAPAVIKLTDNKADTSIDRVWRVDTSSWYGDQSAPIYYRRPRYVNQSGRLQVGAGCERTEAPKEPSVLNQLSECVVWLERHMEANSYVVPRGKAIEAGELRGFHARTIGRAAQEIGVYSDKSFQGNATWSHPKHPKHPQNCDVSEKHAIR